MTLARSLARQPGVVAVSPAVLSPSGQVAIASLYPSTSPQSVQTTALLDRLRNEVIPKAEAGTGVTVLVGGDGHPDRLRPHPVVQAHLVYRRGGAARVPA